MKRDKSLKFRFCLAITIVFLLWFFRTGLDADIKVPKTVNLFVREKNQTPIPEFKSSNKLILFIIDFDDFMCLSCIDSFVNFYHSLPFPVIKESAWGILTYDGTKWKDDKPKGIKVIEKKLRGFVRANSIRLPILIDHPHVFSSLAAKGTSIVLLNGDRGFLREYVFPLNEFQKDEIIKTLVE